MLIKTNPVPQVQDKEPQPIEIDEGDIPEKEAELPPRGNCHFCSVEVIISDEEKALLFEHPEGSSEYFLVCNTCASLTFGIFRYWLKHMVDKSEVSSEFKKTMGVI